MFAFKPCNVSVILSTSGRVYSRLFVVIRRPLGCWFVLDFQGTNGRVRSRLVATRRDCSHLVDVGNVARHRVRSDEILFASLGFDLVTIELRQGTVFLNGANGAGVAGLGVQLGRLLNGKGILMVGRTFAARRVRSRLLISH